MEGAGNNTFTYKVTDRKTDNSKNYKKVGKDKKKGKDYIKGFPRSGKVILFFLCFFH